MARGKTFTAAKLEEVRAYLDTLPSLKSDKSERLKLTGSLADQVYYLLHCGDFTLTEIQRLLDERGYTASIDRLRQLQKVMRPLSIADPTEPSEKFYIDIETIRIPSWLHKKPTPRNS